MTSRLLLRPLQPEHVSAILSGRRRPDWASGYPTEGDHEIARIWAQHKPATEEDLRWGPRHVIERSSGLLVGGVGFFGPPRAGVAELGYGITAERSGRGYATEAVIGLLSLAWGDPRVEVVRADTIRDNVPSRHVLLRAGFGLVREEGARQFYEISRPGKRST
jgi:RimJ/RimL family protein N-acetyltransferase